jgi:uncharacterized protein
MMIVADTSPLVAFSAVHALSVLRGVVDQVFVPKAVYCEIVEHGFEWFDAKDVQKALLDNVWIHQYVVSEGEDLRQVRLFLGLGESEALVLARRNSMPILIDDKSGRKQAEKWNLEHTGTLGILTRAKATGIIDNIRPIIIEMRHCGIYFGLPLINSLLLQVGENAIVEDG